MVSTFTPAEVLFLEGADKVDLLQLQALFDRSAFWARGRTIEDLATALGNSEPVITLWHGEKLIGHGRATSDGVYRATIWDVVIAPEFRGTGLGRKLVEKILAHPKVHRVERVYLMTTYQQEFYLRLGFQYNQTTTMVRYQAP
ncbi:MAG: GNAT family N-acetyltransferase [Pseudanabaenaceae cyanobacterium SKYGB_i_bin29]|nr:GNAT family N-acetyltransferase [Pseudanabaenaceae cyanobacterium SKYG29]MDW8422287.1 GNAT family N-acetyltransferase [Pseudanabaenaceae cyanobacterium SKYGB_i_bin29]